jgi:hypothetical protein
MTNKEEPKFWKKTTTFECEECAYVAKEKEMTGNMDVEYVPKYHGAMDIFTCPNCGRRAIVLW